MASESQLQPAGVDLTVGEVRAFSSAGSVGFDNSERVLSGTKPLEFGPDGWLHLPKGAYKIVFSEAVKVPLDCAAFGFPRSSLLRCGATVECAVWDPGYEGRSESLLVVENEAGLRLKRGARVMQLVFARIEGGAGEAYKGGFQGENLRK